MINFDENPFIHRNAEEEIDYIDSIFYEIPFYSTLIDVMSTNVCRFVLGKRGDGKSMIIHKTTKELNKKNVMSILITNYDLIPIGNNENHYIYLMARHIVFHTAELMFQNNKLKNNLNKTEQAHMSLLLQLFYSEDFAPHFIRMAKAIKKIKTENFWKRIWNVKVIKILNNIIDNIYSSGVTVLLQAHGLPAEYTKVELNMLGELNLKEIKMQTISTFANQNVDFAKQLLYIAVECAKKIGGGNIVVLFDKIDEVSRLNGDIDKISEFVKPILLDTDLLTSGKLSIIFSLWTEIKRDLNNKGVRFDKFSTEEIIWRDNDLYQMINTRLAHFSNGQTSDLKDLLPLRDQSDVVINIANNSPRSLLALLSKIHSFNHCELPYDTNTVNSAIVDYCINFDYTSISPSSNSKDDTISWINKLLFNRLITFDINQYKLNMNIKSVGTAQKHIAEMIKLRLIFKDYTNENVFKVADKRLSFLISSGITNIQ